MISAGEAVVSCVNRFCNLPGASVNRNNIIFVLVMALLVLQLVQHYFFSGT